VIVFCVNESIHIKTSKQPNIRYHLLDTGPYTVAVTANDRRAINPLAMGKFLKFNDVPGVVEINKRHNYRYNITFKTFSTANEFLNHTCLINQNLRAFMPHNRLFRLGVLTNIGVEYTEEEIMEYVEAELPVRAIKRLNKKVKDEEAHIKHVPSITVLTTFRSQYTPQKVRLFYNQLTVRNYKPRLVTCSNCQRYGHAAKLCRGVPICIRCGQHHRIEDCNANTPHYNNCGREHRAHNAGRSEKARYSSIINYRYS
jgi:hypothetical protein